MNRKFLVVLERAFIALLVVSIALMMTVFRGNSVNHNKFIEAILLIAFSYIALKLLLKARKKKYFILAISINTIGVILSFVLIFHPQNRDSFSGMGQSFAATLILLPLFIIDMIVAKINSKRRA